MSRQPVPVRLRRTPHPTKVVGSVLLLVGGLLFVLGYLGASGAAIHIPGDPHHVRTEVLGLVILVAGGYFAAHRPRTP